MTESKPSSASPARACPICGRPEEPSLRPFCSKRCADLDLARWFRGDYAIPGETLSDDSEDEA